MIDACEWVKPSYALRVSEWASKWRTPNGFFVRAIATAEGAERDGVIAADDADDFFAARRRSDLALDVLVDLFRERIHLRERERSSVGSCPRRRAR